MMIMIIPESQPHLCFTTSASLAPNYICRACESPFFAASHSDDDFDFSAVADLSEAVILERIMPPPSIVL